MIFGILNITPDSFSDGGSFDGDSAAAAAESMIRAGADVIDVGGDSTRPGSVCVGPEEEWGRIAGVVRSLAPRHPVSVDTHHAEVASKAIETGAQFINDVSAGADPRMFEVLARSDARLVLMHSASGVPHDFSADRLAGVPAREVVDRISEFLEERVGAALRAGIPEERLVVDPGMGAFLGNDPERSWAVLERLSTLRPLRLPILLGVSRKGFLRSYGGDAPRDRDAVSAHVASLARRAIGRRLYVRVHEVGVTRRFFEVADRVGGGLR